MVWVRIITRTNCTKFDFIFMKSFWNSLSSKLIFTECNRICSSNNHVGTRFLAGIGDLHNHEVKQKVGVSK